MDFVIRLLKSSGCSTILNVIYRLSKERHFIPLFIDSEEYGALAKATAQLLYRYI